jgi:hypothetical protein
MNVIELGYVDAAPAAPPRPRLDRRLLRRVSAPPVVLLGQGTRASPVLTGELVVPYRDGAGASTSRRAS